MPSSPMVEELREHDDFMVSSVVSLEAASLSREGREVSVAGDLNRGMYIGGLVTGTRHSSVEIRQKHCYARGCPSTFNNEVGLGRPSTSHVQLQP